MSSEEVAPVFGTDLVKLGQKFQFTSTGLRVVGQKPTLAECAEALHLLKTVRGSVNYVMGDAINLIEKLYGEEASQVIDAELVDEKTAAELRFVTKQVDEEVRAMSPGWEYSKVIAGLKKPQQVKWLQQALDQDWIASKMKSEIAAADAGGSTAMRFLLIVDAKTETKQKELAKKLESDGFSVTMRESVKKERKVGEKKVAGKKKGKGTGTPRPYARKRAKTKPTTH